VGGGTKRDLATSVGPSIVIYADEFVQRGGIHNAGGTGS
jgi:hypothetical protein